MNAIWPGAVSERSAHLVASAPRRARVLGAFPTALYLLVDGELLPVVTTSGLRLPTSLCLPATVPGVGWGVQPGHEVVVGAGEVRLPRALIRAVRAWRPSRLPRANGPVRLPDSTPCSVAWCEPAWRVTRALQDGAPVEALAAAMVGAGPGLTPSGDDVLCGVLLGLRTRGRDALVHRLWAAVEPRLTSTTKLSAALLAEAAQGYAVPPVVRLGQALVAGDEGLVRAAARDVGLVGHTSGADLLAGFGGCLDALTGSVPRARPVRGAAG